MWLAGANAVAPKKPNAAVLPGSACASAGRSRSYVLKIPASEMMTGAKIFTTSWPFLTLTPGRERRGGEERQP